MAGNTAKDLRRSRAGRTAGTRRDREEPALSPVYQIPDPAAVEGFLSLHPDLAPLLVEIAERLRAAFGAEMHGLRLEQLLDPEDDSEDLVVTVLTPLRPEAALDRLDRFDEEWWLDVESPVDSLVTVTVKCDAL